MHIAPYCDTIILVTTMKSLENRKATFVIPCRILEEIHKAVNLGLAPSVSALVRDALERKVREIHEDHLRKEFEAAARDPSFMRDLEGTMHRFQSADGESARMIPE